LKNYLNKFSENKRKAILLILLFGLISLLGDIIYEGARSVNGPYLSTLGANAAIVGLVVGIGELLGYAIRLLSGYFSDKTKAYWFFTIFGYSLLISVPLLALSEYWQLAAFFIVLERIGKGLRTPAKDTILSHATKQVGTGLGFGVAEFLDQIGAIIGPLIFTLVFASIGSKDKTIADYHLGYSYFWLPLVILMVVLFIAYSKVKTPEELEENEIKETEAKKLHKVFWLYSLFTFVTTLGFINFAIIGYHLKVKGLVSDTQIPLFYAMAMMVDAVCGIIIGKRYDQLKLKHNDEKAGLLILIMIPILTAGLIPLVLSFNVTLILAGIFLWGVVMGAHETIMKAAIADITLINKRGTGYGIFNVIYGFALFVGSAFTGYLYDISIPLMIFILICLEIISIPLFLRLKKEIK